MPENGQSILAPEAYPAEVTQREGRFYAVSRALGVAVESVTLDGAWETFDKRRAQVLAVYERAGLTPGPAALPAGAPVDGAGATHAGSRRWGPFVIKTVVIGVVSALVLSWIVTSGIRTASLQLRTVIPSAISSVRQNAGEVAENQMKPEKISAAIRAVAETLPKMTPERRDEMKESLRIIARELEPYAAELRPLVFGPRGIYIPPAPPAGP